MDDQVKLQFITHFTERYDYLDAARMALEGGCRWIQLRMKDAPLDEVEAMALPVQTLCRRYGAIFVIAIRGGICDNIRRSGGTRR